MHLCGVSFISPFGICCDYWIWCFRSSSLRSNRKSAISRTKHGCAHFMRVSILSRERKKNPMIRTYSREELKKKNNSHSFGMFGVQHRGLWWRKPLETAGWHFYKALTGKIHTLVIPDQANWTSLGRSPEPEMQEGGGGRVDDSLEGIWRVPRAQECPHPGTY